MMDVIINITDHPNDFSISNHNNVITCTVGIEKVEEK